MMADSLKIDNVSSVLIVIKEKLNSDIWLYCIIILSVLLACILLGIWKYFHSDHFRLKCQLRQGAENIDFKNTIDSAFLAKVLYDKLKGKCHPDNFSTDPILFEKSTEIFALLVKNRYNYRELSCLKERAEKDLNINI